VLISNPVITFDIGGSIGVDFPLHGKANRNSYPETKIGVIVTLTTSFFL
jgi:hypothetical protein